MSVKPKKIPSFRDLGGIECAGHRCVVYGKLLRSAHHGKINRSKEYWLKMIYNVDNVVDLRADREVDVHPDIRLDGISYAHIPLLTDEENPAVTRKNNLSILRRAMNHEGGEINHLCDIYRILVSSDLSLKGLRQVFRMLLDAKGNTILWHCTQGKDRTGICSVAILLALGASREAIMKDYLNYNSTVAVKNFFILLGMSIFTFSIPKAKALYRLLSARREYLEAAFDEIDKRYGGDEGFLHQALGLSDDDLKTLRNMYLEPAG